MAAATRGGIEINTPLLQLSNAGIIAADTSASGGGGSITVHAGDIHLSGLSTIVARSTGSGDDSGVGGDINLFADRSVTIRNQSETNRSGISVETNGGGEGGSIYIETPTLSLSDGGGIFANGRGSGRAGKIELRLGDTLRLTGGSTIATGTTQSAGGNIDILAGYMVYLEDSEITTSVEGGAGNGGNIDIDPPFVVLNHSNIIANAFGGNGGNIQISAGQFLKSADSRVEASSRLGINGNISILAPDVDVGSSLGVPTADFLDASRLLQGSCGGADLGGNSFVLRGRGGFAEVAGGPLYATTDTSADRPVRTSAERLSLALLAFDSCHAQTLGLQE